MLKIDGNALINGKIYYIEDIEERLLKEDKTRQLASNNEQLTNKIHQRSKISIVNPMKKNCKANKKIMKTRKKNLMTK